MCFTLLFWKVERIGNLVSFSTIRLSCLFFCTYENCQRETIGCILNSVYIYGFRFLVILELALTYVDLHDMEFMTFSG